MKVWRLIVSLIYATILIKNANSVDEPGQESKLNKTFDEIFGKGWDAEVPEFTETKEWHKKETQTTEVENKSTDQNNPNEQSFSDHFESFANRKIRERFDEMNEFIEEDEADSTDQNDCIDGQKCQKVQENGDPGTKRIKRRNYSDKQKREIVEEFIKKKNEFKQKRKYSQKEWDQNNSHIAKSIGVGYSIIKKWKKAFGLSHKLQLDKEKREKLKQYCEIKKNNPKIKEVEIAGRLNIGRSTLRRWKMDHKNAVNDENNCSLQKELDQIGPYSDQQKRQILKQFNEIKIKCKKEKLKSGSKNELDKKIAKKLGFCRHTIFKWKSEFGLSVSKKISDATKIGILKKYAKIKEKNPKMSDGDIADLLKISISSLNRWKIKFSEENKHL